MKKVAVVGATGLVGKLIIKLLENRKFPIKQLIPVASYKSIGKTILFNNKKIKIVSLDTCLNKKPCFALFSAGAKISHEWSPKFAKQGTYVIDNSSAWRLNKNIKLIVPEINGNILTKQDKIIANPNCSTIQLVMILHPLHLKYNIKRVIVSTYQSVTGSGKRGIDQLISEETKKSQSKIYSYKIHRNVIPQCDIFDEKYLGYTKEEIKMIEETKKIMNYNELKITTTATRVPVIGGHSESVNIEFNNKILVEDVKNILHNTPGITVQDDIKNNIYPMPITSLGKDDVFVGRIRKDSSVSHGINLWIVSDNLRKGAATNTIQIAEKILTIIQ